MRARANALVGAATSLALLAAAPALAVDDLAARVGRHLHPGEVAYVVGESELPLVAIGANSSFVPASTLKVFTALLVREHLGLAGRFRSEFYLDDEWIVVRGFGDPYLVSEEIAAAARRLVERLPGVEPVGVAVDDSYFAADLTIPGVGRSSNPYDARNSAVAVNFNTIHVERIGDRYFSAEPQTPITPLAITVARRHGVTRAERLSIGHSTEDIRRHAAEIIAAKLREAGMMVGDGVGGRTAPTDALPVYVHVSSRTMADCVTAMLEFSSNYIANQLFLAVGAAVEGAPATVEKSTRVARRFIDAHPDLAGLVVTEGSGISRANKATAPALASVLARFEQERGLLPLERGVQRKTGTLRDVRSMVGYLDSADHGTVRFVIWMDGSGHQRRWRIIDALAAAL